MSNYTSNIFFSEVRGTSVYTRVKIDIEGEDRPLVIGFDIPGGADHQEVIDQAIQSRIAQAVLDRTSAKTITETITDQTDADELSAISGQLQETINQVVEPAGMTSIILPLEQVTPEVMQSMAAVLETAQIGVKISDESRIKVDEIAERKKLDIGIIDEPVDEPIKGGRG